MRVRSERPSKPTVSMSVLGRDGGNMYVDRFVEFVNFLLKKRNSSHAAFDMALQFTPHLPALMHAHAAYETAVLGVPDLGALACLQLKPQLVVIGPQLSGQVAMRVMALWLSPRCCSRPAWSRSIRRRVTLLVREFHHVEDGGP
jgi:hypothetical protein